MTTPESKSIKALVSSSAKELDYIDMLSGNLVGQLLKMLIRISGAKRVLEIGTFTGYSALMMSEALSEDGQIITIEMNGRYHEIAAKHFEKFSRNHKIELLYGDARELMNMLEGTFELIYMDADKLSYAWYYEKSLELLESDGLLVVDNVLWDGTVLEPKEAKAEAINLFNRKVAQDERVEQVLLPIRDGLSLIRKK